MAITIPYDEYLDRIHGGWIGKSIGGTVGARFEGYKGWIELAPEDMFPPEIPPNDDLDLQILWLKVLEEKGAALTADDLAAAWLELCWYPFNEYGTFRRNWRLGIHPPYSGGYDNEFWETGMGSPIRSEIWGYVFPGAPDVAAAYAGRDGRLDHTEQSAGAEMMFAAMASLAFTIHDLPRLIGMTLHYLPAGTTIERLTRAALDAHAHGLPLREARELLLALEGHPEACDSRLNVPFTILALLYGGGDMTETLLAALRCGYDTDCTLATAGAFLGQLLGARGIPGALKDPIGDQLVMGIQYRREEMTLSALASDTARVGVALAREMGGLEVTALPAELQPVAAAPQLAAEAPSLRVDYDGSPCAAPGQAVAITVHVMGRLPEAGEALSIEAPAGWSAQPAAVRVSPANPSARFTLTPDPAMPSLPMRNLFHLRLGERAEHTFGVAGVALWRFLGVYFDPLPPEGDPVAQGRRMNHHFVDPATLYLPEPEPNSTALFRRWSRLLGRPAVVTSRERKVDLAQVINLQGEYVAYLTRTILCPSERDVWLIVGNNDAYRLYLNGELVGEADEQVWWTPFNNRHRVHLREGRNEILLKLVKRGEALQWSLGIRETDGPHFNGTDWTVDLADANPLLDL